MDQPTQTQLNPNDHDLLIRVSTLVETLTTEVRSYNSTTASQLSDHENRIRTTEAQLQEDRGAQKSLKTALVIISTIGSILLVVVAILAFIWR